MNDAMRADGPGRRILIVEDESLVAMDLEDTLVEEGYQVVGIATTVAQAIQALERLRPEIVTLDLNLNGETTLPVAELMLKGQIRFVILSGYGSLRASDPLLAQAPLVTKPWNRTQLLAQLESVLASPASTHQ